MTEEQLPIPPQDGLASILAVFDLSVADFYGIIICGVLFYLYSVVVSKVLFQPFLKLHEAREAATSGAENTAEQQIKEAGALEEQYENELSSTRVDIMKTKLEKLMQAGKQASSIVAEAEDKALKNVLEARKEGEAQSETIRKDLTADVEKISDEIVARLKTPLEARQ